LIQKQEIAATSFKTNKILKIKSDPQKKTQQSNPIKQKKQHKK